MMTQCPQCGSTEIIPDLILLSTGSGTAGTVGVVMQDPKHKQESARVGFRVAVCGKCGHAEMYTRFPEDLLEAHKKGFETYKP